MSDLPWEIKKGAEKESPEDTPSAVEFPWEKNKSAKGDGESPISGEVPDMFADAFADIPMEEASDPEVPGQPDPFVMPSLEDVPDILSSIALEEETIDVKPPEPSLQSPSFSDMPDIGEVSTPQFDAGSKVVNIHDIDMGKPPEIPVIDALSEEVQDNKANEVEEEIPSYGDVFGLDTKAAEKEIENDTELHKSSPHPLFEPQFPSYAEETEISDKASESISLPPMAPSFEVYGQESPKENESESESESPSPFPPVLESAASSPFPPVSESEASSPFPPVSESESPSPFPPVSESEVSSPFPPSSNSQHPLQPPVSDFLTESTTKKSIDGIVKSLKNILKTLTRGGSLIDRMEDLREEVEIAEEKRLKEESEKKTTLEVSPFPSGPNVFGSENQLPEMGQPTPVPQQEIENMKVKEPESERVAAKSATETVGEPYKDEMRGLVGGLSKDEIQVLVGKQIKDAFDANIKSATPVEPMVSATANDVDDLKNEVESSKVRIDEIVNNIEELSNKVESSAVSMNEIKRCADEFDSEVSVGFDSAKDKIGGIEDRLEVVENTLTQIQSGNADMKVGLSNIEQNISELVGSYSVILTQMQESEQSTDARFENLSAKVNRIDAIDSKILQIENNQTIVAGTITEFGNTASVLMSDIAEAYEANETLKDETKFDNATLRDEMALVTEYVEKGLKKAGAGSYRSFGQDVELVHLEKNSATMKLCMEWLEFLMELVGRNNLPDILSYYEELEWISDDVRLELMRYAEGIDYYLEKPDWKLNPDEHVKSIWFIEKLAGIKVDKNKLSIIERDIERVKKGTEIYGI